MKLEKVKRFSMRLSATVKRFPLAVVLLFVYALFLIFLNVFHGEWKEFMHTRTFFWLLVYPPLLVLLTMFSKFRQEYSGKFDKRILVAIHVALLVATVLMVFCFHDELIGKEKFVHMAATIGAVFFIALANLWTARFRDDVCLWNFWIRVQKSLNFALPVSLVCIVLYCIYIKCFNTLFDINLGGSVFSPYAVGSIFCGAFVFPVLFLAGFPYSKECETRPAFGKSYKLLSEIGTVVLLLYVLLLYAYMARILGTWCLPKGTVVYTVSVASSLALVLCGYLYPIRNQPQFKILDRIREVIPVLLLPLLTLMTVGIGRRICDYGLTTPRIYVIALNIWFFMAFGILLVKKIHKKIWWMSTSFVFVLALLCFVPFKTYGQNAKDAKTVVPETSYAYESLGHLRMPIPPDRSEFFELPASAISPNDIKIENDSLSFKLVYGTDDCYYGRKNGADSIAMPKECRYANFRVPTSSLTYMDGANRLNRNRDLPLVIDNGEATAVLSSLNIIVSSNKNRRHYISGLLFVK